MYIHLYLALNRFTRSRYRTCYIRLLLSGLGVLIASGEKGCQSSAEGVPAYLLRDTQVFGNGLHVANAAREHWNHHEPVRTGSNGRETCGTSESG